MNRLMPSFSFRHGRRMVRIHQSTGRGDALLSGYFSKSFGSFRFSIDAYMYWFLTSKDHLPVNYVGRPRISLFPCSIQNSQIKFENIKDHHTHYISNNTLRLCNLQEAASFLVYFRRTDRSRQSSSSCLSLTFRIPQNEQSPSDVDVSRRNAFVSCMELVNGVLQFPLTY